MSSLCTGGGTLQDKRGKLDTTVEYIITQKKINRPPTYILEPESKQ